MKLYIEKETLIEDVKRIFTNTYPFLKIELYKKRFAGNFVFTKKEPLTPSVSLNKFIHPRKSAFIDISHNITIAELEYQFAAIDLMAEIFRKSGNVWIETSLTSNWSLQQQNAAGEAISLYFTQKKILS